MENWLNNSHLKESEKVCSSCHTPYSGSETLNVKDDGNIVVKYVDCLKCEITLVLDVARHDEIF